MKNNITPIKRYKVPVYDLSTNIAPQTHSRRLNKNERAKTTNYWIVYVLKLENGCWYVGKTTQHMFAHNMNKHEKGSHSWFTAKNKPIRTYDLEVYPADSSTSLLDSIQNQWVLHLVESYGREKVRGGGYVQREPHWGGLNNNLFNL